MHPKLGDGGVDFLTALSLSLLASWFVPGNLHMVLAWYLRRGLVTGTDRSWELGAFSVVVFAATNTIIY
jgi:hypothetical protein